MNILFLTMSSSMKGIDSPGIYTDLIREFVMHGHTVYVVAPVEKRAQAQSSIQRGEGWEFLRVRTGNVQKSGLIEKGIAQLRIQGQFMRAIERYFKDVRFDLVVYSTPPITFSGLVRKIKRNHHAATYLLLKDIFPQNAVDLGIMTKHGIKALIYRYFRRIEKSFYSVSDYIGCMSDANCAYIMKHNPEIDPAKVEVCPNSVEVKDFRVSGEEKTGLREKYGIPLDKKVFVYGGNLGRPQGIPFLIECLKAQQTRLDAYFLIIGDGTEYAKLEAFFDQEKPSNMNLLKRLPKEDYDRLVAACDVGMIFLDHRFTIPNFPSRLLSYMQAGLPVLACTDPNTDVGTVITEGGFGWWCESNDVSGFSNCIERAMNAQLNEMGMRGFSYLNTHYTVERSYKTVMKHYEG